MIALRINILGCLLYFLALVGLGVGQTEPPAAPGLTFLYSLNCTLGAPIPVGKGPHGTRLVIPIVGGSFSGPRLSGRSEVADGHA